MLWLVQTSDSASDAPQTLSNPTRRSMQTVLSRDRLSLVIQVHGLVVWRSIAQGSGPFISMPGEPDSAGCVKWPSLARRGSCDAREVRFSCSVLCLARMRLLLLCSDGGVVSTG